MQQDKDIKKRVILRVIAKRAKRLARLVELNAPDLIINNECRMLFEALLAFDGSRLFASVTNKIVKRWMEAYADELAEQGEAGAEEQLPGV